LSYCSSVFDLAVWSSSSDGYVTEVTERVFGSKYPLVFSWSASKCVQKEDPVSGGYLYIKDLRKVRSQGYDVENIIMVDDSPEKIRRQPNNLVAVSPFEGGAYDNELLQLVDRLQSHV
jgi:RNA polymerase II subunit A small phosphatase-like protein